MSREPPNFIFCVKLHHFALICSSGSLFHRMLCCSTQLLWLFSAGVFFIIGNSICFFARRQKWFMSKSAYVTAEHFKLNLTSLYHIPVLSFSKYHIFWEGHKILRNLHYRFVLCSKGQIYGGDFAKFCVFLWWIYELYYK